MVVYSFVLTTVDFINGMINFFIKYCHLIMKRYIKIFTTIALIAFVVSCGNSGGSRKTESYLSRDVSYYSTPNGDAFGCAIKLNRANKSYKLYENSFRNQEWRLTKSGNYSEEIKDNVAICDLNIEPEHFGDVYEVKVYLNTDRAAFISISSELDAHPCSPIE